MEILEKLLTNWKFLALIVVGLIIFASLNGAALISMIDGWGVLIIAVAGSFLVMRSGIALTTK